MKKTLIKIALKAVVYLLEKLVAKWQNNDDASNVEVQTEYIQDVQINKETAKMFNKYIKAHTIPEKGSMKVNDSEGC